MYFEWNGHSIKIVQDICRWKGEGPLQFSWCVHSQCHICQPERTNVQKHTHTHKLPLKRDVSDMNKHIFNFDLWFYFILFHLVFESCANSISTIANLCSIRFSMNWEWSDNFTFLVAYEIYNEIHRIFVEFTF